MKMYRRLIAVLLAGILFLSSASAYAITSTEKENNYNAAVTQLEVYLESARNSSVELAGVHASFDALGGYEQSRFLSYYTSVLMKIAEEEYDYELYMFLDMLERNQSFNAYLKETLKGSSIGSVEELKAYAHGREYEHDGANSEAIACYGECLNYFDASARYFSLQQDKDQAVYNEAAAMLNRGDLAGAYFKFSEILRFKDSKERRNSIANLLGYTPSSPTDDLEAVTASPTPVISGYESGFLYKSGEIMIYYYLDGALSETEQRIIKNSQQINPKAISGYDCSSSGINVNLDTKTGQCTPSTIQFYYQTARKKGPGNSYDMGKPNIGSRVFHSGDMNMIVFWVQTQMKATGKWYQGDNWDCSGNLGDHTISEISSFMKYRGYSGHSGNIDQSVIDELASYLGNKIVPVHIGGMYDHMESIMMGDSIGTMKEIVSNLRDMIPHETTGARWIQVCLKKLGYYNSNIDGKYGEGTEQAVKRFQKDYGWQQRDYVTLGVARAILEAYYSSGGNLNNLP